MNLLLRAIGPTGREAIAAHLETLSLTPGQRLHEAGREVGDILFPETATIILSVRRAAGEAVTTGLVGREGAVGGSAITGPLEAPFDAIVSPGGGMARTIVRDRFVEAAATCPALRDVMARFAQAQAGQLASSVACALRDPAIQRLARWLLMLHDRQEGDELAVTHDTLAADLDLRRASVTDYLHLLEGDHAVRCTRGRVAVRDRDALEAAAGAAYGSAEAAYRALLGDAA